MECRDFAPLLDDYLDGWLDATRQQAMQEHMEHCPACRRRRQHAVALLAALRTLPAPASHPGFADEALLRARRTANPAAWSPRRAVTSLALAATLVLGIALGVFFATQPAPAPVPSVTLTLARAETVRLMFNSAEPLSAVTVTLSIPENVHLVGYENQRELTWQTDLREGGNLLQLPLVVYDKPRGELVARLSHGESSRTFRLKIEVKQAGQTDRSSVGLATT